MSERKKKKKGQNCFAQLKSVLFDLLCVWDLSSERWQSTLFRIFSPQKRRQDISAVTKQTTDRLEERLVRTEGELDRQQVFAGRDNVVFYRIQEVVRDRVCRRLCSKRNMGLYVHRNHSGLLGTGKLGGREFYI